MMIRISEKKREEQALISQQTEEFLKSGGVITEAHGGAVKYQLVQNGSSVPKFSHDSRSHQTFVIKRGG